VKILYLAPDVVPAPKGAAVRIQRTVRTLGDLGHEVEVLTPPIESPAAGGNFLARMLEFRAHARAWLAARRADVVQFRSIWEGIAAVEWAQRTGARAVFEAHGFPSVELPYHFPALHRHAGALEKLIVEERRVLAASDRVIVPSRTSARFVLRLGVPASRIAVVPNAVDVDRFTPGPPPHDAPPFRLVYVGTLAPWQGLAPLIEAIALLKGRRAVELHLVGPVKGTWGRALETLIRRLHVRAFVHLSGPMAQADLAPVLRTAHACAAPLPADPRNELQGCCPLKILEYMAAGRPILATRIAPVEELLEHDVTAHLVRPGSAAALADGIAWMIDRPAERERLGARAREAAIARWTPEVFSRRLDALMA
jgi:glycosyltransferase involved in cell wall biosynthesis